VALGEFKSKQNPAANFGSVFNGLQPWGQGSPVVMPKIGVSGPGGEHQIVVIEFGAAAQFDEPGRLVNAHHLFHEYLGIRLIAQDGANRLRDVGRRELCECYLIEQRLKGVMIASVHDRHVYGEFGQPNGSMKPGKSSANNHYTGTMSFS
jgi:hypothetical protein